MKYPLLASKLYNAPLLLHPAKAEVIEAIFRAHATGAPKPEADPSDFARPEAVGPVRFQNRTDRPYPITEGGVAVISVLGTLVQRASSLDAMSGLIGYNRLERQLSTALEDPSSRAILLEVDSPGGEVNGCFDLAAKIFEARKVKPVWAHANEQAFSAAYALACGAERLVVPPTGLVGSIGVIAMHVDQSKRDSTQGYSFTPVYAGDRKNDFSSHEPLNDTARAALQAEVDRIYGIFTAHVARCLGISEEKVRATQAGLLNPEQAKAGGFVHEIAGFAETVLALEEHARKRSFSPAALAASQSTTGKEQHMEDKKPAAGAQSATTEPAKPAAPAAAAPAEPVKSAADERARVSAILNCEEAKQRPKLAQHLALETGASIEDAKKTLAAAAVETQASGGQFSRAMADLGNPQVGADAEKAGGEGKPSINTQAIYAARRPQQ